MTGALQILLYLFRLETCQRRRDSHSVRLPRLRWPECFLLELVLYIAISKINSSSIFFEIAMAILTGIAVSTVYIFCIKHFAAKLLCGQNGFV